MYCIYLRKSRADYDAEQRGEGETLARHRDILTALAAHNRHAIGHIYQEIVSGETIADRPQVQQLIADLGASKWKGVYVMELERLARGDAMDQGLITHAFKASGALIITPLKTYDPTRDQIDETFLEFSLFMSRQEYKTINRRMQSGRDQSACEGKFLGSRAAYGYRIAPLADGSGPTLIIHEEEAAVVRQIFDWYLNGRNGKGVGITAIGNRLTELRVSPGLHGKVWNGPRVHRILTNPVYIGIIQWKRNKTIREVTPAGVTKKRILQKQGDLHPGLHPSIISKDVFDAVQKKLHSVGSERMIPAYKTRSLRNPLAHLVVCSECGRTLKHLPETGRIPARLVCPTHGCPTVQSSRDLVERAIFATLRSWLADAGRSETSAPPVHDDHDFIVSSISAMKAEKQKLLGQIDTLYDLVEQRVYTPAMFNDRHVTLSRRISELDASIVSEQARLDACPIYATPAELLPSLVRLMDLYDTATPEQKNALLKECISKVIYKKLNRGIVLRGKTYSPPANFELVILPKIK